MGLDIEGITFDFGGTLASGNLDIEMYEKDLLNYLRSIGFSGGRTQFRKAINGMLKRLAKVRANFRELRFEDLYQGLLSDLLIHPEEEFINYIHDLYINSFNTVIIAGVESLIQNLSENYKLALVSNAISNAPRKVLEEKGLNEYFDSIVISRDIGLRKPDPEIFNFALAELGVENLKALHVGDSLEEDVQGAKRAGMTTVWLDQKIFSSLFDFPPDHIVHSLREIPLLLTKFV